MLRFQHLIAEYHELPRVIKQNIDISSAPLDYVLGAGHMRWAAYYWQYTYSRFIELCDEMKYRGFAVNYPSCELEKYLDKFNTRLGKYQVTSKDIELNRARIKEKYLLRQNFYRWTNRKRPKWITE